MSRSGLSNRERVAIEVNEISKYYRLGAKEEQNDAMASALFKMLKSPIKNFKNYHSLYNFSDVDPDNIPDNVILVCRTMNTTTPAGCPRL